MGRVYIAILESTFIPMSSSVLVTSTGLSRHQQHTNTCVLGSSDAHHPVVCAIYITHYTVACIAKQAYPETKDQQESRFGFNHMHAAR